MFNPPFTLHEPAPTHPKSLPFGRGGAGNRTSPSRPLPPSSLLPPPPPPPTTTTAAASGTYSLRSASSSSSNRTAPNYSTGRGGAGNMHAAGEERRMFSFDEELAKEAKAGAVPVYHVGRGGQGNAVDEGRRASGGSVGSKGSAGSGRSLDWIRGLGRKG